MLHAALQDTVPGWESGTRGYRSIFLFSIAEVFLHNIYPWGKILCLGASWGAPKLNSHFFRRCVGKTLIADSSSAINIISFEKQISDQLQIILDLNVPVDHMRLPITALSTLSWFRQFSEFLENLKTSSRTICWYYVQLDDVIFTVLSRGQHIIFH